MEQMSLFTGCYHDCELCGWYYEEIEKNHTDCALEYKPAIREQVQDRFAQYMEEAQIRNNKNIHYTINRVLMLGTYLENLEKNIKKNQID